MRARTCVSNKFSGDVHAACLDQVFISVGISKYNHMVLEARMLQIPPTTGRSKFLGDHMSNDVSQPLNLHSLLP